MANRSTVWQMPPITLSLVTWAWVVAILLVLAVVVWLAAGAGLSA